MHVAHHPGRVSMASRTALPWGWSVEWRTTAAVVALALVDQTEIGANVAGVVVCPNCRKKNRVPVAAKGTPRCAECKRPLPWVVDAGDANFAAAADAKVPVLIDLWAPWCGPCRTMAPGLEKVAANLAGKLKVVKVNVDEAPRTAARFDARSIPTLVLLQSGKKVATRVGAAPADQLEAWIRAESPR